MNPRYVLPWAVLGILLFAAACGGGAEPVPVSATATVAAVPESSAVPPNAAVRPCRIEQCAAAFADALVSGDLVVLTRSFTPLGLRQARTLQELSGTEGASGTSGITSARTESIETADSGYEIAILVDSPEGAVRLITTWILSPDSTWRVQTLALQP